MIATVLRMLNYRVVFALTDNCGTVVLSSSPDAQPRVGPERPFDNIHNALGCAGELSSQFGCVIIGGNAG